MGNRLDRAIRYVAPQIAARREFARAQLTGIANAQALYDGAARSWRTSGRYIANSSANAEYMLSGERLRAVSRDLRRNNSTAANAVTVIAAHVVGAGIIPAIDAPRARLKKAVQNLAGDFFASTEIDFEGRHNLAGLQGLVMETVVESGEALIVRKLPPANLKLSVPLQVRVLEPEYLDATKSGPIGSNGGMLANGIEFDAEGRRVAYWIYDEHPGSMVNWRMPVSKRVDARDVTHVYRQDRPGQMRGIPWAAPVIMNLWDLHDYQEAELIRQKIAACFAVFITGGAEQNLGQKIANEPTRAGNIVEKLEPGMIQRLPQGVDAKFATPPTVQGYSDYVSVQDHHIAIGYGVPYELLSGNMREVSFISGRLGLIQFNKNVDRWRKHMLIPHACDGIARWFKAAATIALQVDTRDVSFKWTPPRREMIEPAKEVPAMRDAIRSGLSSLSEEIRSLGSDPDDTMAEIVADNEKMDALGLVFDSDGRKPLEWKPIPAEKADGS